jgi:isoquinoline 1-oxidoreductase
MLLMNDFLNCPLDEEDSEVERYELRAPQPYYFAANRREFAQTLGAGILIAVSVREAPGQRRGRGARREETLSQRFHLGNDGTVTVLTSKVEVGQGSRTQLTQAAAEELLIPSEQIRLIMADSARCPDDGGTAGSRTTPSTVPRVRAASAALRELLKKYAAGRWGVAVERVTVSGGVFAADGKRSMTIADFAQDPELLRQLEASTTADEAALVPVDQWKVLGTTLPKVNAREIVTGAAQYPSDVRLPGMYYGKVIRPPAYGATLRSVDLDGRDEADGVVVHDGDFLGCAAATSWQASKLQDALARRCQWDHTDQISLNELWDHFKQTARSRGEGDRESSSLGAEVAHHIESRYTVAYIQHAPMEPRAAVANWDNGKLTVWTGTQQPARVHGELCNAFRLPADAVHLMVPDTGGGFGGKHTGEVAIEAARLAKAAQRPVSLRWTREEEFTWAYFRPAGLMEVTAGLDATGKLVAWDFTNFNSGGSAIETPYRAGKVQTRFASCDSPLRQGSYRALASTANTFARESAMDELALLANIDPLEFRLRHLEEGRLKDVLRAAAERFGWAERRSRKTDNRGIGLACGTEKGSFVAACAEVEMIEGTAKVLEICQVFECGAIQNPVNLRAQHAGCVVMGLGGAGYEAIEFSEGKVNNPRFSAYRVPRMRDVPKLDLLELNRKDLPSVGAGETPIIAVAPAVANAICHASGVRRRSMPLDLV